MPARTLIRGEASMSDFTSPRGESVTLLAWDWYFKIISSAREVGLNFVGVY